MSRPSSHRSRRSHPSRRSHRIRPEVEKELTQLKELIKTVEGKNDGKWVCLKCTLINDKVQAARCSACSCKRPAPKCLACMEDRAAVRLSCHGSQREELCIGCYNTYLSSEVNAGKIKFGCRFKMKKNVRSITMSQFYVVYVNITHS